MLTETLSSVLLVVLAAALATIGYGHFRDGVAADEAKPIPAYMVSHRVVPKSAYIAASEALAKADRKNGNAALEMAEASMRAGIEGTRIRDTLEAGLTRAPASSRGWTLLSEALYATDKRLAGRALAQALILAPREYWLVGPQVLDAARLWSNLDSDAQRAALAKAELLWSENVLHPQLRTVLNAPEAARLVARSLSNEEIRALNRWLVEERVRESRT